MNRIARRSRRPRGQWLAAVLVLAAAPAALASPAEARFQNVGRVVAVGDIHGAYDALVGLLQATGLVDEQLAWSGGTDHFVSLGDLVDRGARSRDVMELLMRLQQEARAAGGRVHVLVGNHDVMNVTGELQYVSDAEFAAFAAEEDPAERQAAYARWLARSGRVDEPAAKSEFEAAFPPGFFGHRAAFSPGGRYGEWILSRPVAVVVNDTAFVHGGLTELLGTPAELNATLPAEVRTYAEARRQLLEAGILQPRTGFSAMREAAKAAAENPDPAIAPALEAFIEAGRSLAFSPDGPLWYRGTAYCHPYAEVIRTQAVLDRFGARRVVLGHTPTTDRRFHSRMKGRVLLIDSGMLQAVYEGHPGALVIDGGTLSAVYLDGSTGTPGPEPRAVGGRPDAIPDDRIETVLRDGQIVAQEDVGIGVTAPLRLTLEHEGLRVDALFKTESTELIPGSNRRARLLIDNSDRWQYEVAAYRLDRLLGLNLVPVTVERTVDGRTGSLQLWVGDTVSELDRKNEELTPTGWCPLPEQWVLMYAFDGLIYNTDRTLQNIVYDADTWMLYLIDHSRAFRLDSDLPADLKKANARLSEDYAEALRRLDRDALQRELGEWLTREQIRAIIQRRDRVLSRWGP